MDEKLVNNNIENFAELLASPAPAPGGGGAAALAGAMAAALCAMAARLTAGRKKYAHLKDRLDAVTDRADAIRRELLALIDGDAEGFKPLAAAYSLPKDAPGYAGTMRAATLEACRAPWEMLLCCRDAAELLEEMLESSSPLLLSDVGCGAALCRGAMEAAAMNIFVNTRSLKGDGEAEKLSCETRELLDIYTPRLQAVADEVMRRLCM